MRFEAADVGADWFDANVPCTQACPVLTNAGRYVAAIAAGDDELAYRIARLPNPFPSICGRVCAAPCEIACRRGSIDQPIAIRALKRYVCEKFGVESGHGSNVYADAMPMSPPREERVAIVGAGPAGMACAHDLATYGYRPVVFEAQDRPGGMMVLGIPPYRLRRDVLQDEIRAILDMGVELRTGQALGRDFSLRSLKEEGFDCGVPRCRLHAGTGPGHPGRGARRGAPRRRLPPEREPRVSGGARGGRGRHRRRERGARCRPHRAPRDRGRPVDAGVVARTWTSEKAKAP